MEKGTATAGAGEGMGCDPGDAGAMQPQVKPVTMARTTKRRTPSFMELSPEGRMRRKKKVPMEADEPMNSLIDHRTLPGNPLRSLPPLRRPPVATSLFQGVPKKQ
jgi:hypothetical protein